MASATRDALGTMDRDVVADGVLHVHTPLLFSRPMSDLAGRDVYIKLDAFQPSGSFKLRGIGYACQKALREGARSFTSSSGGNAGLATAYAGAALGVKTTVVVPSTTPPFIRDRLEELGARVVVHGAQWSEANEEAQRRNAEDGGKLVHPFDDADAWTGHATLVHEAVADLARREKMNAKTNNSNDSNERETDTTDETDKIAAFVTCVGGGGLLMGILQGLRETGLDAAATRVVAAETLGADSMASSLEAGAVVTLPGITSVAKSLGAAAPSARVFAEAHELYRDERDRRVLPLRVSDEDAVRACLRFADDHRVLVEPACGAALAAVCGGQAAKWLEKCADGPVVVEVCGGAIVDRGILQAYAKQFGIE